MINKWLFVLFNFLIIPATHAMYHQTMNVNHIQYDVVRIDDLANLELFLKSTKTNRYYQRFSSIQHDMPTCEQLNFAMNAGMYHANSQPVGLYIEKSKQVSPLNQASGFGNFFMQPNGVLAWNQKQALITTTADYKQREFKAAYATQSGPMLVSKGKINPQFLADSDSLKIRNGVGIKDNQLYFVISQQRVNFYQFAQFFKQQLNIEDALYLDGTISSLYLNKTKRHDKNSNLGPIVAEVNRDGCK